MSSPTMYLLTEINAAARRLRRAPTFTFLAALTLAAAIGANVAIFSIFHSILLAPLPYPEPERLVGLSSVNQTKALTQPSLSAADFRDVRERATQFAALAACRPDFASYAPNQGDAVQLVAALVTEDFLGVLRVSPALGRGFRPDEFALSSARTALISHACWQRLFSGRVDIVGSTIRLNNEPTTVIGVMPDGFREPEFVDIWLPFPAESPEYLARDSRFWTTVGRLKPGSTLGAARTEAATIAATLADEYSAIDKGWTIAVTPLLEQRVGGLRRSLAVLVGAVGLVLLVGCVNLANLMLARGLKRMPELALRLALGSTPAALARQVIWESVLLALLGGTAGTLGACIGVPWLAGRFPPGLVPRLTAVQVDGAALGFALAVSIVTGLVFGLLPAWQVLRADVSDLLKSAGTRGTSSPFTRRAQSLLIIIQVAVTLVVLAGATLLVKSLVNLQRTYPGFEARNVLTARVAPGQSRWQDIVSLSSYYEQVLAEVRAAPGVESAAFDCSAPLTGLSLRYPFWVQGRPRTEGNADEAVFHSVSAGVFDTLRLPLRQGRFIDNRDDARAPKVCVVNEAFVRRIFPGENPIGKRVQIVPWLVSGYREIVGVVGDTKQDNLSDPVPPQIYVPQTQSPWFFATLLVRTRAGAGDALAVQHALRRVDPALAMPLVPLEERVTQTAAQPRLRALLFTVFGIGALGLSAFGIYASMTFSVRQRTREIGVRLALGASPADILRWVLTQAGRLALIGVGAGLIALLPATQLLNGLLYGVGTFDLEVLAGLTVLLPVIAILSSAQAGWAASRLKPTLALQAE